MNAYPEAKGPPAASQLSALVERALASKYVPASVIVNDRGEIFYIHGRTGAYLEPSTGQPRNNILEMAREGLRFELAAAIRQACTRNVEVVHSGIKVKTNGDTLVVNVSASKISEPEPLRGLVIVTFEPAVKKTSRAPEKAKPVRSKKQQGRIADLERELQYTQETLQSTVEELETSNEELKSSNEELQSTNEELQSTNEELVTSKEELQSLNEELQTVNAELQCKVDDLARAGDDMHNLFNSTEAGVVFLDTDLNIVRFTENAKRWVNIIQGDVGRPLSDLVSKMDYDNLIDDARNVLRTLVFSEKDVPVKDDGWCRARIMPYRTLENVIDGVLVDFTDVTVVKQAEQDAQQARAFAESIVETLREPLLVLDSDLRVVSANHAFLETFKVKRLAVDGHLIYELGNRQWDTPSLRLLLEDILPKDTVFENFEVRHKFPHIGHRVMLLNARRLEQTAGRPGCILLAFADITEQRPGDVELAECD